MSYGVSLQRYFGVRHVRRQDTSKAPKPADLPVEQPRSLSHHQSESGEADRPDNPPNVLARADKVISNDRGQRSEVRCQRSESKTNSND